ncbi:MAG: hypothetical protein ACI3W6_05880 [Clostridia bacterium]
MSRDYESILDIPGCVIELSAPAIEGQGEDAYGSYLEEQGCSFAVFDGCGGSGGRRYAAFQGHSGAYVASRLAMRDYFRWYIRFLKLNVELNGDTIAENLPALKKRFCKRLSHCREYADSYEQKSSSVSGTLMKDFPTTMSAVLCDYYNGVFSAGFLWAGNSRGYVLGENGLVQITVDDIAGTVDAMDCLRKDPPLTNFISAEGDFELRGLHYELALPVILITATDGCFDYFPSPMHFEYMLISAMAEADSYDGWRENIRGILTENASDDFSVVIGCFGYADFETMKNSFRPRLQYLWQDYIEPLMQDYNARSDELWLRYKPGYYRRDF